MVIPSDEKDHRAMQKVDLSAAPTQLKQTVNFFLTTRRLCLDARRSGEDHLTEFVAATLASSPAFREAYVRLTLAKRFGAVALTGIETQVPLQKFRSIPDMRLSFHDAKGKPIKVLVEHKIDAAETTAQVKDDEDELIGQLERYLDIPDIDGVLYFRRSPKDPSAKVLKHPKYVRPTTSTHFLWENLYEALKKCEADSILVSWLREGFEELGFLPPPDGLGDLYHPNPEERVRHRRALERYLSPIRELLIKLGWSKVWPDQKGNELKAEGNPFSPAFRITLTGSNAGPFTIRVVPKATTDISMLSSLLERAYAQEHAFLGIIGVQGDLNSKKTPSLLLQFKSLTAVLQKIHRDAIADRLMSLASPAISVLSPK
jgi:hypothetical protein